MVELELPKLAAWVRFPSPAPFFIQCFMLSCKFLVSNSLLNELNSFIDSLEILNVSIFEDPDLGFSNELDEFGFPIAKFFNVEIFMENEEDAQELKKNLEEKFGDEVFKFSIEAVNNQDWVDLYTKELTPVLCDKFYFYNDYMLDMKNDESLIPIKLNSALAFGSGHHQTTQGCLLNLCFLDESKVGPKKILDMGCGTGILGICALKLWKDSALLGIDIDQEAVDISIENYIANDVQAKAIQDFNVDALMKEEQLFDLILCNILKQPLIDLCDSFYKVIAKGGYIVTSGYIKTQEEDVVNHYLNNNFELVNRICIDDWLSILFKKKHESAHR